MAAALLLAYAAATVVLAPIVLSPRRRWPIHQPRLALALWHAAFVTGGLAAIAAIVSLIASSARAMAAGASASGSWPAVVLGWCAVFVAAGAMNVASRGWEVITTADRGNRAALLALPHTVERRGDTTLVTCHTSQPVACSLPGPTATVVISDGVLAALTPAQVDAVVAHERAHLRHRHHLAMRVADVNLACLPRLPSTHGLRRATALLIELIADDVAAREVGPTDLANALLRLGTIHQDQTMRLRAERITQRLPVAGQPTPG